ncbi:MAG: GspH/FimT family protein [Planctomycetota bacterium]|nr:GspH/FimT family protein [Planctomycetota bacterium]
MSINSRKNRFIPAARRYSRTGFTLIELIVALVVLAVAAAIIIPYATGTSGFQASAAARMIMSDLEYAQNQAITTQTPVSVTFAVSSNSYTVSNASGTLIHPISKQAYVVDFDTSRGFGNVSMSSANFGGASVVTFDALGAPDNNGTVTVVAGAHTYTVTVAPISGRVTVSGND